MKLSKNDSASQVRESAATRKREERERKRSAGLVPREIWIYPSDWPKVQTYLSRLNGRRTLRKP
jgi:hypothetical protein